MEDIIIKNYETSKNCILLKFSLSIDSEDDTSTFLEPTFIKIDNDSIHNKNEYIANLIMYNTFITKDNNKFDISEKGFYPYFKLDHENICVLSPGFYADDDGFHSHGDNVITNIPNIKKVYKKIYSKYLFENISEDELQDMFDNNHSYNEYHDYVLTYKFTKDAEEFKKYYKSHKLTMVDLIKHYEKKNNKIILTLSTMYWGTSCSSEDYYEFDLTDLESIANKIIEYEAIDKHKDNPQFKWITNKNCIIGYHLNQNGKKSCPRVYNSQFCGCSDYSSYARLSSNKIAKMVFEYYPNNCKL